MQLNILLAILVSLVIGLTIYLGFSNWRTHKQRQQATAARGWRYTNTWLRSLFRSAYIIAGQTPNGGVWEMRRTSQRGLLVFTWTTTDAGLPYGLIRILPRRASVAHQDHSSLHLAVWRNESWQQPILSDYVVLTSHQQLGQRFLTREVALMLSHWPEWPLPGALAEVTWNHDILEIQVRYIDDWATVDRMVALGTALVSSLATQAAAHE